MQPYPKSFTKTVIDTWGEDGRTWLIHLPTILSKIEKRWSLTVQNHFPNLSYNYAAPAIQADGTEIVLKVGIPRNELGTEIEALRLYNGRGMVRLLDADADEGVLLLERLRPGTLLSDTAEDDDEVTRIAANIMRQLWQMVPPQHSFPSVADWGQGLHEMRDYCDEFSGVFPQRLVDTAVVLYDDLLASSATPVLLHGDLHHFNILTAERQPWLAIDPKGVVGEPAYEVGALLRNPVPDIYTRPHLKRVQARRLDILAEMLSLDRQRLQAWSMSQAVLSIWWSFEDNDAEWQKWLCVAESLI
ncbi:MAG: phosphotransferase [Chloroflexi bacterium]|nr:phosphotransferase [Chloroflexota bacterium]